MNFRHTEALDYIKKIAGDKYDVGIILGTGHGRTCKRNKNKTRNSIFRYSEFSSINRRITFRQTNFRKKLSGKNRCYAGEVSTTTKGIPMQM